jgi:3-hydroxyisobutyrate dehydrogenase-like beta-hydroxyacid dehydrogenase
MRTVGLIGVGMIGMPMAKNILKGGFSLAVYAPTPGGWRR